MSVKSSALFQATQQLLPKLLQELISVKEPTHLLESQAKNNYVLSQKLRDEEWTLIRNVQVNGYSKFDLALIYKILRNLNIIPSPTRGWDHLTAPSENETTIGDDVERIRRIRNKMSHCGSDIIPDDEISECFTMFKSIASRFEKYLGIEKGKFSLQFEKLETFCDVAENHTQRLENLEQVEKKLHLNIVSVETECRNRHKNIEGLKKHVWNLSRKVSNAQGRMRVHSPSLSGAHQLELDAWETESAKFVETKAVEDILDSLVKYDCVCVTGASGAGKSALVHHIAISYLFEEGFQIIPCRSASNLELFFDGEEKQAFVIDDVCGKYTLIQNDVELWINYEKNIKRILAKQKTKILVTCRSQVFKENQFQRLTLFVNNFFDVSSEKYSLSVQQKLDIARQYLDTTAIDSLEKLQIELDDIDFFPLKCSLYNPSINDTVENFFRNPFDIYTIEVDTLRVQNDKTKFCALFLCVMCNTFVNDILLSESDYCKATKRKLKCIYEACGTDRGTPKLRILEQIDSLLHTYLKKVDNKYQILHDRLYDFLCSYFGRNMQKCVIQYADFKIVQEYSFLKSVDISHSEFAILVERENENEYFKRITSDVSKSGFQYLFKNKKIKDQQYRTAFMQFIQIMNNESAKELLRPNEKQPESALSVACFEGYLDLVDFFLPYFDDINCNKFSLPLHEASYGGHESIVEYLIDKGADVNKEDCDGWTALIGACRGGHHAVAKMLIKNKADVNKSDKHGTRPLTWTQRQKHEQIQTLLLVNGAYK